MDMDFYLRFLIPLSLLWLYYEIRKLRLQLQYIRLIKILVAIEDIILIVAIVKTIASAVELLYKDISDWVFILSSTCMFVALAIFIRTRRQRFTEQWNKHNIGDDAVFEDIGQSLETTTKILNEDIHKTS